MSTMTPTRWAPRPAAPVTRGDASDAPVVGRTRARGAFAVPLFLLAAVLAGSATAVFGTLGLLASLAMALFTMAALVPVSAVYTYMATLPFLSGIDRDVLLPLVRPNEALLALMVAGVVFGGYFRFLRGDELNLKLGPLDPRLGLFVLLSTVWPITWLLLRGTMPGIEDVAALLPVCKLGALLVLVRVVMHTDAQLLRLGRIVTWTAAVIAVIGVLQTVSFPPVIAFLSTYWTAPSDLSELSDRGGTTFASPIASGDYIVMALALLLALGVRELVSRREQLVIGMVLVSGTLAAGQFSTWASAAVVGIAMLTQYPELRRLVRRMLPLLGFAMLLGLPAFVGRLSQFGDGYGVPRSWLGRWDNLVSFYLPGIGHNRWVLGVGPNSVLQAPETWREVIYLEYGYLQFLWVGGLPLLAAFVWLSVGVLRYARRVARRPDAVGAYASALWAAWWMVLVLSLIDIHLVLRGAGELLFTGLAVVSGALSARLTAAPRPQGATVVVEVAALRSSPWWERTVLRTLDITASGLALLIMAPTLLALALWIRLDSPGPALLRQERVGHGGRTFPFYKFRSMHIGGDDRAHRALIAAELRGEVVSTEGSTKLQNDPRVTRAGSFLRRTSLDEVPQLLNVLRGDMTLVGPRPCLSWEAEMFPPEYAGRFSVRPGLTGLWQVGSRSTVGTLEMLEMDMEYVRTRNLRLDIRLLLGTVPSLLRGGGAR
jgi:lipopolysaccharide/colanic/teichoic acid biosynthesis glycosyltransferase